jgi:hypothetical protein
VRFFSPTCSRCVKTSMCKNPKKPQRRPEPSDDDWSRTTEMLLSLRHKRSTAVVHNSWGGGKRVVVNVIIDSKQLVRPHGHQRLQPIGFMRNIATRVFALPANKPSSSVVSTGKTEAKSMGLAASYPDSGVMASPPLVHSVGTYLAEEGGRGGEWVCNAGAVAAGGKWQRAWGLTALTWCRRCVLAGWTACLR